MQNFTTFSSEVQFVIYHLFLNTFFVFQGGGGGGDIR